jgi:thioredoxin-like negative regulator of GroEL
VIEATPSNFEAEVFNETGNLVLVYFWGPQCPNCEVFARHLPGLLPELEKLKVKLVKVNAYQHEDLATRFGLHGIPTFLLMKQGKLLGRMTSFNGDEFFLQVIREKA